MHDRAIVSERAQVSPVIIIRIITIMIIIIINNKNDDDDDDDDDSNNNTPLTTEHKSFVQQCSDGKCWSTNAQHSHTHSCTEQVPSYR